MDIYKLKWTRLQNEIFRLLTIKAGTKLNQRTIANLLKVSPTAVSKAIKNLEKESIIKIDKDKKMNLTLIELNRDSQKVLELKKTENLRIIYESNIVEFLEEKFPGALIILFGSYSYGEDTQDSDIDLAIIGYKSKKLELEKFEKILKKEIRINFYNNLEEINKNLKSNLFNGITLSGRITL